ncbi:MAG: DsrE/DsrF/DrsH-like family protein [Candidatus Eisenbacteria bacterium]|nr:DsrE/DsrF/DrsH-like family protein [Candidatus Eisenbacteria bacterium]
MKVTLVVFSGDMDKAMAAFNIAIGAGSMGMEVSMFFTFWGIHILKRPNTPSRAKGLIRRMLSMMSPPDARKLPLSKLNMLGIGPFMMKKLMKQYRMPGVQEMISLAEQSGVKLIACTTTMELMGISKDQLVEQVDRVAGVATYLSEASESGINLFV